MATKYIQDKNGNYYADEDGNLLTVDVSGEGGGASSNNGMPTIRLVTVRDTDGTMSITENNPLTFTVEITSGSLQVGDQLQICNKELYTYKGKAQKRYKLRRFAEYVVTEDDLNKKHLYLSVGNGLHPTVEIDRLCRGGRGNDRYPKYIRLRRGIPHQETGEPWSASFSNAIQIRVYGYARSGSMDGASLTIR